MKYYYKKKLNLNLSKHPILMADLQERKVTEEHIKQSPWEKSRLWGNSTGQTTLFLQYIEKKN